MLKRRSRQGTEYIIDPLMYALEQFVKAHTIKRFPHTTVCFVLVYDRNLPERRIRDYDNLELKSILDAAAAYLMKSDAGLLCDTYHTTELGEGDDAMPQKGKQMPPPGTLAVLLLTLTALPGEFPTALISRLPVDRGRRELCQG